MEHASVMNGSSAKNEKRAAMAVNSAERENQKGDPDGSGEHPTSSTSPLSPDDAGRLKQVIRLDQRLATILGAAISLMVRSPLHRNVFLSELEWRVLAPLTLGQSRLFIREGMPFAFATWANVSDEVAQRLKTQPMRLQMSEWNSGQNFVIVDLVAPFGDAERCLQALHQSRANPSTLADQDPAGERPVAEEAPARREKTM